MASLSKQQILSTPDRVTHKVMVPEWGDAETYVLVRSLNGKERGEYERQFAEIPDGDKPKGIEAMTYLLVATIVDDDGNPLFTNDDIASLVEKNAVVIYRIWDESLKLNRLGGAPEIEKLKGN